MTGHSRGSGASSGGHQEHGPSRTRSDTAREDQCPQEDEGRAEDMWQFPCDMVWALSWSQGPELKPWAG